MKEKLLQLGEQLPLLFIFLGTRTKAQQTFEVSFL